MYLIVNETQLTVNNAYTERDTISNVLMAVIEVPYDSMDFVSLKNLFMNNTDVITKVLDDESTESWDGFSYKTPPVDDGTQYRLVLIGTEEAYQIERLRHMETTLALKEQLITSIQVTLADKENAIIENLATIAKHEKTIAQHLALIDSLNGSITEKVSLLAEKDTLLAEKEATITQQLEALASKESIIAEHLATIATMTKLLSNSTETAEEDTESEE